MTARDRSTGDRDAVLQRLRQSASDRVPNCLLDGGQALPAGVRGALEPWVGADLAGVRVHAGEEAGRLVRSLDAIAVTVGRDILLGPGSGAPGSAERLGLLAHEAVHTAQQGVVEQGAGALAVDPSPQLEAEARAAGVGATIGADLIGGPPRSAPLAPSRAGPAIMRAEELPPLTNSQLKQWERIKQKLNRANLTMNQLGFEEGQVIPLLRGGRVKEFLDEIEKRADSASRTKGAIAAEFAERQRLEDPFSYLYEMGEEAAGGSTVKSRSWPGNRGQSRATATGTFMHTWAEDIIVGRLARAGPGSAEANELCAQLRLTWPAGVMPNEGPNRLVIRLESGKTYIPDGIDRAAGMIYELKPEGRVAEGLEQGRIYAAWMDAEYPLDGGRKWQFEVVTYSMEGAQRFLVSVGYLAPRPPPPGAGGAGGRTAAARSPLSAQTAAEALPTTAEAAREVFATELQAARTTGKLSERGIEALWELDPRAAEYLLGSSGLPRSEQRRVLSQLPGRAMPMRGRIGGAGMLALQVAMDVAPAVQAVQEKQHSENVGAAMADVLWWLDKGVVPHVVGVSDPIGANERTYDLKEILDLNRAGDLDYLAITAVDEEEIESGFLIWASSHLVNYRDWFAFIESSEAIRGTGDDIATRQWSFRAGDVKDRWYGFDVTETWLPSPALTRILNSAAVTMLKGGPEEPGRTRRPGTEEAIARLGSGAGPRQEQQWVSQRYKPLDIFGGLPQSTGKKRFRDPRRILYRVGSPASIEGFRADSVLYTFPASAVDAEVPDGYVVVGGADFATYEQIYRNNDIGPAARRELMLAREDQLEDVR